MATRAELEYLVSVQDAQLKQLQREIAKTNRALGRETEKEVSKGVAALNRHARSIQKWSGIVLGTMVFGAFKATQAATDLNEEISKAGVIFKKSAPEIVAWSKTTAKSIGVSRTEALQATGVFGNMLVPMGVARDKAAAMSKRMVTLAGDMASFNNADPKDVLESLRSGLAGETEPLRKFGVFLNDARLKQEAMNLGIYNGKGPLTALQKGQATYALILKDTKDAQGDYARTSDSAANKQRTLRAQVNDLSASFGQALLPALDGVLKILSAVFGFLAAHQGTAKAIAGGLVSLTTAFFAVSTAARLASIGLFTMTGPIGLIIGGIALLVTGFMMAYASSETFRAGVDAVVGWVKSNWKIIASVILAPFVPLVALATDAFGIRSALIGAFQWLVGAAGTAAGAVSSAIKRGFLAVVWDFPRLLWDRVISPMVNFVQTVVQKAQDLSAAVPRGIRAVIWGLADVFRDRILTPLGNLSASVLDKGKDLASAIARGIREGMDGAKDAVVGVFKGFLNGIIRIFNKIPFVPNIPELAEGGILRGPTLAVVGEDGPEAVIPLGKKRRKRGQELLSMAAKVMGLSGDYPGPFVGAGRAGRIPMLANGGFVVPGASSGLVALQIAAMKSAKTPNGLQALGDFAAKGLAKVIGTLPDPPNFRGDKLGMVRNLGRSVKENAVQALRDLFARKDEWSPGQILDAYKWANAQMGKPYVWGGGHGGWNFGLPGYDCSGFASHAAYKAGGQLSGPGTTMSLFPITRGPGGFFAFGFRGMGSSDPRRQHMGARILGEWYQFGDPGRKGGGDSQWDSVRGVPGLPGYRAGTPFVQRTGPAILHRGEAVVPAHRNGGGAGGGALVNIERMEVRSAVDADLVSSSLARKLAIAGLA